MSKAAVVALFLAVPLLAGAASVPSTDPPSSLEPGPHGTLTLSHRHWKLTACDARHDAGQLVCHAERNAADAGLVLGLRPIRGARLAGQDPRHPVTVNVPAGLGLQSTRLKLRAGIWEIDWPRHKAHARFLVHDGDEFRIQLMTRSGLCHKVKRACVLDPDRTERQVKIPAGQRAPAFAG